MCNREGAIIRRKRIMNIGVLDANMFNGLGAADRRNPVHGVNGPEVLQAGRAKLSQSKDFRSTSNQK